MGWEVILLTMKGIWGISYFHPDARKARQYERTLAARDPLSDANLVRWVSLDSPMSHDIPPGVRSAFAKLMEYPAEKIYPDDDFKFFWNELDLAPLIEELKERFQLTITNDDCQSVTKCTIRSVAEMVARVKTTN